MGYPAYIEAFIFTFYVFFRYGLFIHFIFSLIYYIYIYIFQEQKKGDWRKKREEFINTLRAAKEAQRHLANGGSLKDLPPPPPMDTSDYIQCPHCNRR